MIVLEALCLKVSVVSHAVGAIPRVLEHGRYGTLVRTQSPEDYVRAIENIAADPDIVAARVAAAHQHVRRNYSVEQKCQDYLDLYYSVVGSRSTAQAPRALC